VSRVAREKKAKREGEAEESGVMLYILGKDGAEYPRPLPVRSTMLYIVSLLHGPDIEGWVGKELTLFRTTCLSFNEVEECVRIRVSPDIDRKVLARLKKRKASPKTYMMELPAAVRT
jgi:hypothetical protein